MRSITISHSFFVWGCGDAKSSPLLVFFVYNTVDATEMRPVSPHVGASPHIVDVAYTLEEGSDLVQLAIVGVINERGAVDGILGMEDVRAGRVINNDALSKVAVQQTT